MLNYLKYNKKLEMLMANNYFDLDELKEKILSNRKSQILAIDFGTKKIGLCKYSFETKIFSRFKLYKRSIFSNDILFFSNFIEEHNISIIIIGASIIESHNKEILGNEILFQNSLSFIKNLLNFQRYHNKKEFIFKFFDESFSSMYSNQLLYNLKYSRKYIEKNEDSLAAYKILYEFLKDIEAI